MNEKLIERKLKKGVDQRGGLALKIFSPWFTGFPDRLILLPIRKVFLVETKSTGEKLKPRQKIVRKLLEKLGFEVDVIDTQEKLDLFFIKVDV